MPLKSSGWCQHSGVGPPVLLCQPPCQSSREHPQAHPEACFTPLPGVSHPGQGDTVPYSGPSRPGLPRVSFPLQLQCREEQLLECIQVGGVLMSPAPLEGHVGPSWAYHPVPSVRCGPYLLPSQACLQGSRTHATASARGLAQGAQKQTPALLW